MGQVNAPKIQCPTTGLTEFESKLINLLFMTTGTNEISVERLFDVLKQITPMILKEAYDGYVSFINQENEAVIYMKGVRMPLYIPRKDLEDGDNVKVLIIKEIK